MQDQEAPPDDDAMVRLRLHRLLEQHSQSEIARKTGHLVAGVNRYVHGARVPAAFCAALVRGLGVNPSWLLVGEGAPYLSDVPAETARLGENLLELVEAMNAIARMRLGSLTGKHHLKVLRELNDALMAHERLREKLNEQSRPLFRRILEDLKTALDNLNLERATELRQAALQLSRLCDDEALARDFTGLQAYHEFQLKNSERFLHFQRRLFLATLPDGALFDERACDEARRIVVALVQMDRMREAHRICRATRNLVGRKGRRWDAFARLENTHGVILTELGFLHKGLAKVQRTLPRLTGMYRRISEATQLRMMMWGGMLPIADAARIGERTDAKSDHILQFACWLGDKAALRTALDYANAPNVEPVWRNGYFRRLATALLEQLERPDPKAARQGVALDPGSGRLTGGEVPLTSACNTELLVAAGDRAGAMKEMMRCEEMRRSLNPEVTPHVLALSLHFRNALRLIAPGARGEPGRLRRAAFRHFETWFRRGYVAYGPVLAEHGR
ncbi:MAG: helix-turn-helix transcriptional regulator [Planctomycetes bacterium]|jgi:transcriptional regulator with XRE-family HTH domain|nr:helix-turn-helix transcriptional regulator [Planctomycetota bacterium]MCL4730079.1 helix-turn-helix domain-containing protein [Planctomycetota bacterium]